MNKACSDCKFEIDVYSQTECSEHLFQELKLGQDIYFMCCHCGIDSDYIWK
jgi:hypothetical protein